MGFIAINIVFSKVGASDWFDIHVKNSHSSQKKMHIDLPFFSKVGASDWFDIHVKNLHSSPKKCTLIYPSSPGDPGSLP